jgi:hypothetical protein
MKNLILCLLLLVSVSAGIEKDNEVATYKYTVLHLNAKWNNHNSLPIQNLKNVHLEWALLEEQSEEIKNKFNKIPFIALKENGTPIKVWEGNIMFKPTVTIEQIQEVIDSLN